MKIKLLDIFGTQHQKEENGHLKGEGAYAFEY